MDSDNVEQQPQKIPLVFDLHGLKDILSAHNCKKFRVDFPQGVKNGAILHVYKNAAGKPPKLFAAMTLIILNRVQLDPNTAQLNAPMLFSGFYLCNGTPNQSINVD